jgi:hypothetical protein
LNFFKFWKILKNKKPGDKSEKSGDKPKTDPFLVNAIDLQGAKVLVWPEQAELTKVKNVIIDKERHQSCEDKIWSREVMLEKPADGKDALKIIVKASTLKGGGASRQLEARSELCSAEHTKPIGQIGHVDRSNYGEPNKDDEAEEPRSG